MPDNAMKGIIVVFPRWINESNRDRQHNRIELANNINDYQFYINPIQEEHLCRQLPKISNKD